MPEASGLGGARSEMSAPPRPVAMVVDLQASPDIDALAIWADQTRFLSTVSLVREADRAKLGIRVEISHADAFTFSVTAFSHRTRHVRSPEIVAVSNLGQVVFQLYDRGSARGTIGARKVAVPQGGILALDLAEPYDLAFAPCRIVALTVPRADLPEEYRGRDLGGLLAPDTALTRLFAEGLRGLDRESRDLSAADLARGLRALLGLAGGIFAAEERIERWTDTSLALRERALVVIEERIGNPTLSVGAVAAALKVSRASLYRLFEAEGGLLAYLRERRLQRTYEVLALEIAADLSLKAVAAGEGFASEAHFSRVFRARFGMTPGEARAQAKARRRSGEAIPPPPNTPGLPGPFMAGGRSAVAGRSPKVSSGADRARNDSNHTKIGDA